MISESNEPTIYHSMISGRQRMTHTQKNKITLHTMIASLANKFSAIILKLMREFQELEILETLRILVRVD
jgi:hypothetical protein